MRKVESLAFVCVLTSAMFGCALDTGASEAADGSASEEASAQQQQLQRVAGGHADLSSGYGRVCADALTWITVYYAYARIPGYEMGGNRFVRGGCINISPPEGSFRHYHVCNNRGQCSPEKQALD